MVKITFYNKDNNGSLSYDYLFRILFNLGGSISSDILPRRSAFFDAFTIFHDIEYMDRAKNRKFDEFNDLYANAPDGKPHVKEFGNVKPKVVTEDKATNIQYSLNTSSISLDRELLFDVTSTDKEVKVVLAIPGIKEVDLKIMHLMERSKLKQQITLQKHFIKLYHYQKKRK